MALANLDGSADSQKELIVGYNENNENGMLKYIDHDGTLIQTYSMYPGEQIGTGDAPPVSLVASAPTLGDVVRGSSEGNMEIVIGGSQGTLYVWDSVTGTAYHCPISSSAISSAPALADVDEADANQDLDIVLTDITGTLFMISYPGASCQIGWSSSLGNAPLTTPTIGDVDGDDELEVVTARMRSGKMFVFNADGTRMNVVAGTTWQVSAPPSIADVDRDGDYELIASDESELYVWHVGSQVPHTTMMGYPFARGNIYRDGAMPSIHLYPQEITDYVYNAGTKHYTFKLVLKNMGTATAYNVEARYVGTENSEVAVTDRIASAGAIPPYDPGDPATLVKTDTFEFDLTSYNYCAVSF